MIEKPRVEKVFLLSILALAFGLRVWGLGFGLPALYHADEPIVVNHALAFGSGDFNPHFFKIPPLASYVLCGIYALYYLAGHFAGHFSGPADFERLFYSNPSSFYFAARFLLGAVAGTLTVYFFYRMVRRHFDAGRALAASFFLAVCFLHVSDSHYVYADIPLLLVIVSALDYFLTLAEKQPVSLGGHLAAGGWIGLAAAFKYNGVFLFFPYAVVLWKTGTGRPWRTVFFFAVAGAAALTLFTLFNPFWILDGSFFIRELQTQARSHAGVGLLHHFVYSLPGALGWPILGAAMLGITAVLKSGNRNKEISGRCFKRILLVSFVGGYYLVLAAAGQPYARYVLPLLPGFIFFAADFLFLVAVRFPRWNRGVFCLGILLLAAPSFVKSLYWDRLMAAPDVRDLAKEWAEGHLPSGAKVALDRDFYMPRLSFSREQLLSKQKDLTAQVFFHSAQQRRIESLLNHVRGARAYELYFLVAHPATQERFLYAKPVFPYNLSALEKAGVDYVFLLSGEKHKFTGSFYGDVARRGKRIAEFSPYKDKARMKPYDEVTMTGGPFTWAEIRNRERNGQAIEVYELSKNGNDKQGAF